MDYSKINSFLSRNDYTIKELKTIAKELQLKQSGNKQELYERIKSYYINYFIINKINIYTENVTKDFLTDNFDSIYNKCYTYKNIYEYGLCSNNKMWKNKTQHEFGLVDKINSWCETYQTLYEQDKYVFFIDDTRYTCIDTFDFTLYNEDLKVFEKYFDSIELYLRYASIII